MEDEIHVEVALALPATQLLKALSLPGGSTVRDAIAISGVLSALDDDVRGGISFGVWGHVVSESHCLKDGDRVEIYRPLTIDPREARRRAALAGKTMRDSSEH